MVEAAVEEELAEEREGGEEERAEDGGGGARRVGGEVGDVAEAELGDVDGNDVWVGVVCEEVADDAVGAVGAEVVGEEGAPGDVGIDGVEDAVDGVLLGGAEEGLLGVGNDGKGQEGGEEEEGECGH